MFVIWGSSSSLGGQVKKIKFQVQGEKTFYSHTIVPKYY
jgi:hypothetical protein